MDDSSAGLPIKQNLTLTYIAVLVIAVLLVVAALMGISSYANLYPPDDVVGYVGTDAFTLVIVVPILLIALWFARRGSLIALLLLPGMLVFGLYVYVAYLVGIDFNRMFPLSVSIIILSTYAILALVAGIDAEAIKQRFAAGVPARTTGLILVLLALLFGAFQVIAIADALINGAAIAPNLLAVGTSDLIVQCPLLILGGVLLWQRKALGYLLGAGLLLQIGALFLSLPISSLLSGVILGSAVDTDLIAVGSVGLLPLALIWFYLRQPAKAGYRAKK